ncbi:MAG: YecH family protein [Akkermansiaceae bacterium]|nr:YecH family protein [Akkermansiaceae bacterium]
MDSIHGHDVIEMIQAAGHPFTREALLTEIGGRFGADARFHTCSAENMTANDLVEFLAAKGKFFVSEEGLTIDPAKVCQH